MNTNANDESGFTPGIDLGRVSDLARLVLDRMCMHSAAKLNVPFEDEESMTRLHAEWTDLDRPMDVLSFPMDELQPTSIGEESREGVLGGIVVCSQVAAGQTYTAGHAIAEEALLLVTHGVLCLPGYNHAKEDERHEMFDL